MPLKMIYKLNIKGIMKKLVSIIFVFLFVTAAMDMQAQWLKSLGQKAVDRAKERAKDKVEQKVDEAVDKQVDGTFDEAETAVKGKEKKEQTVQSEKEPAEENKERASSHSKQQEPKTAEMAWNSFDFVAGDELVFDDNQTNEQLGEFPSRWDLVEGEAEIAKLDGVNVICLRNDCKIRPLMKNILNYFGEAFTIEFDYYFTLEKENEQHGSYEMRLTSPDKNWAGNSLFKIELPGKLNSWYWDKRNEGGNTAKVDYKYWWETTAGEDQSGNREQLITPNSWVHLSLSFNKRAIKIYVNETRIVNIPNLSGNIGWVQINYGDAQEGMNGYIKNFRIAKGAVPLYNRMMSEGKFITYGITFDVGKSIIKPESMGEINRIVKLMNEKSDLKLSVEGHTDSTGNPAMNQTLSEARSKAIVDKLVEMGISANRLTAIGKGHTTPLADNGTEEGRAKNRRVEFIKL